VKTGDTLDDMDPKKKTGSRYGWASVEEVMKVLQGLNGECSEQVLAQEIAGMHGIDKELVKKQLSQNDELTWMRPEKGKWLLPKREYDL
jgi:hypothetical protein